MFTDVLVATYSLAEMMLKAINKLPVRWDASHALDLGVIDVKDSKESSGIHFRRFINRCNVLNSLLANRKGFAFLQMLDKSAMRTVS